MVKEESTEVSQVLTLLFQENLGIIYQSRYDRFIQIF
jgi:hypothetical protein